EVGGAPTRLWGKRIGCCLALWQAERLPYNNISSCEDTCSELLERELQLPKQGHIRARLWFASRSARVSPRLRRFLPRLSMCQVKSVWRNGRVPSANPSQAIHAKLAPNQPCRLSRSKRKSPPNQAPSASFPSRYP